MDSGIQSPWFTVAEAAKYAKVGEETITRWIKGGQLRPAVTHQKKNLRGRGAAGYLIERDDIDKFLRTLKVNVAEPDAPVQEKTKRRQGASTALNLRELLERDPL